MKNIIGKIYKRFDRFLKNAISGNLRLKARVTAILTGILILAVVTVAAMCAFIEFEITVPAQGGINKIIDEATIEFKLLVSTRHWGEVETGQKAKIEVLGNGKTLLQAKVTRIEKIAGADDFSVYLENTIPSSIAINKDLLNKKVKCRIIIDKKKVYQLLLK